MRASQALYGGSIPLARSIKIANENINGVIMQEAKIAQSEIGRLYNRLSKIYDLWGNLAESKARNRALELADIKNSQNILEVAVGTGWAFKEIVKRNPSGFNCGIDLSDGMLEKARKKLKNSTAN